MQKMQQLCLSFENVLNSKFLHHHTNSELMQTIDQMEDNLAYFVRRSKVIRKGMAELTNTFDTVEANKNRLLPQQLADLIQTDTVLAYVPSWPLLVHLFSGCFCLGCSTIFHLLHITNV